MRKAYLVIVLAVFGSSLYGQNVATVNGKPISSSEFLWVFKKNHINESTIDLKDLESYLTLYLNFKLKVEEAKKLGLDLDTAYITEIKTYEEALKNQQKYPLNSNEYKYLLAEYREGVLMFNLSEKRIWSVEPDSDDVLKQYFVADTSYSGKQFEEVRAQLLNDYQRKLEEDWVKDLRSKYNVKINKAELKKMAKQ